ncbi:MAG: hypothetical protein SOT71_10130 [Romboutsia timonensis]|uniref:hypothetical protein n=1 Tax=Romboutsia timonensis TaxID=1776391 RepID=UPI002A75FCBB|nr:hypothetical protein [Romboutsia timonensis]MDY2882997.1 hypothetical protein [Romboutsia timonensis]
MCEVRFNITQKDGKLERMMQCIPSSVRTEVVKEAIRYFLNHVRDNKVESDYIDSDVLSQFKTDVQEPQFTISDVFKLMESRAVAQPVFQAPIVQHQPIQHQDVTKEVVVEDEEQDEFDIDLSQNQFNDTVDTINTDDINMDGMDW